ncbi:MAG: aldo/keto reductase [Acidimicrobiia bacterium]|nr:aldo/keto reductase [Acidimicrobiia bacterium]
MDTELVRFSGDLTPVPPLGVGTWAWGDRNVWGMGGYDTDLDESSITEAWQRSLDAGIALFDTAEVYGDGESERIIGRLLATDPTRRERVVVATKFMPAPWKINLATAMRNALEASLERLGVERVDLYQIHGPISLRSHGAMAEALAGLHADGLVRAVGVSNYSVKEMGSIHAELAARHLALATNQIEFSLLRTRPLTSGLLAACHRLGVVPLAYSPIGQGRLTGKYSAANPPPGRRTFSAHPMEQVDPVVAELRRIGEACGGRSPAQVALRWTIEHGAIPIPGAKNGEQASQNAGALGWTLGEEHRRALDAVALEGKRTLPLRVWQHG